jgi:hypothetical protein
MHFDGRNVRQFRFYIAMSNIDSNNFCHTLTYQGFVLGQARNRGASANLEYTVQWDVAI